ncbi:MAG: HAMP domain-containing histidine kinase [Clostridiales bacterium]|nr:HAMP domain-containing histidine kinase [Clostridiales bacterium]
MKKGILLSFIAVFVAEIIALIVFAVVAPDSSQDVVAVNEIVQSVSADFDELDAHKNTASLDYTVINNDGKLLYKTKSGLSETINQAIAHRDTVLDITNGESVVGKVIIYNDGARTLMSQKRTVIAVLAVAIAVQCCVFVCYVVYLQARVIKPFRKLKGFAERVACGNLDIPLEMDRGNLFGAFTESFDIMRSELKKARLAEAAAQQSKKELVAKLSHDIKTPIASIKAVSEVGLTLAKSTKDKSNYTQIINKSDQINTLVTNLFTATLEELEQLTVTPTSIDSRRVKELLENADYLHRADIPDMPECLVYADSLRLQQVFDNIFANSYKYANTDIAIAVGRRDDYIDVIIEDEGGGVSGEELLTLKEKFKRGNNAQSIEGAGLGLYISDYFMREMGGALDIANGERGLRVTVTIPLNQN